MKNRPLPSRTIFRLFAKLPGLAPAFLPLLAAAQTNILFEDTFDREAPLSSGRNIQETLDGITNLTGAVFLAGGDPEGSPVYFHGHLDPNSRYPGFGLPDDDGANGASARIINNTLELASERLGTSNAIVNHNFVNTEILAAGSFSVSLDVHARGEAANGNGGGFAIGLSLDEALSSGDAFNTNPSPLTGGLGTGIGGGTVPAGVLSDFWIVLRANGSLAWGGIGGTVGIFGVPAGQGIPNNPSATIGVTFHVTDFSAGSTVNFEVFYNNVSRGTGSFVWSGNFENYIALEGRNGDGVTLDNFRVATGTLEPPLLPPAIAGFESTALANGKTRLHWSIGGGASQVVLSSGPTTLHTTSDLRGFVDVDAPGAGPFTLSVANASGSDTRDTTPPAPDSGFASAVRAATPLAWYRFNEAPGSTLIVDSADNAAPHNGSIEGTLYLESLGSLDGSIFLPGGGGSILLNDLVLDPAGVSPGYTIEAIVRRYTGSPPSAVIVSQIDGAGTGRSQLSVDTDGAIQSFLGGGGEQRKDADGKLPAEDWAHLTLVVDAATPELRWYLDGVLIGSSADGLNPDGSVFNPAFTLESATGSWRLGAWKGGNINHWFGDFDEIVVYGSLLDDPDGNGDRTDSRVAAHTSAWLASSSGLLGFSTVTGTIPPGSTAILNVKVGADVTSVVIDQGIGAVTPVNGVVSVPVSPSQTTTYTLTTQSDRFGSQTLAATVQVADAPALAPEILAAEISEGNFRIIFRGAPSTTYRLRASLDLQSFDIDLGDVATGADGGGEASVPLVAGRARQFYRIEEAPAP